MIFNKKKNKIDIFILTSQHQASIYLSKYSIKNNIDKIIFIVFSKQQNQKSINKIKSILEDFKAVDVLDFREIYNTKIKFKKKFFLHFNLIKKIIKLKFKYKINNISIRTKIKPIDWIIIILSSCQNILIIEDGTLDYVDNKKLKYYSFKNMLNILFILLFRSKIKFFSFFKNVKIFKGPKYIKFLNKNSIVYIKKEYVNFMRSKKLNVKINPILIFIGKPYSDFISGISYKYEVRYYENMLSIISKKLNIRNKNKIIFIPHPLTSNFCFNNYLNSRISRMANILPVAKFQSEIFYGLNNVKYVIGPISHTLFLAKKIFNIKNVFYTNMLENNKSEKSIFINRVKNLFEKHKITNFIVD